MWQKPVVDYRWPEQVLFRSPPVATAVKTEHDPAVRCRQRRFAHSQTRQSYLHGASQLGLTRNRARRVQGHRQFGDRAFNTSAIGSDRGNHEDPAKERKRDQQYGDDGPSPLVPLRLPLWERTITVKRSAVPLRVRVRMC